MAGLRDLKSRGSRGRSTVEDILPSQVDRLYDLHAAACFHWSGQAPGAREQRSQRAPAG